MVGAGKIVRTLVYNFVNMKNIDYNVIENDLTQSGVTSTVTDIASGESLVGSSPVTSEQLSVEAVATGDAQSPTLAAWERYQNGDESASYEVLNELNDTIDKAVVAYANGDPQMKTQARILALEAVKTYDPTKGAQLSTYVYGQLQKLRRESAQRANLTYVSENVAIERNQIQRQIREYVAEHGEEPTTEQLADLTGLSVKRIDSVMNYKPVIPDSIAVSPEGDSLVRSDTEHALDLYDRLIYDELDDIDKKIYEWVTGYGKGEVLSQAEIAKRLGISPAAVSKRYKNIVAKFGEEREIIRQSIGVAAV